MNKKRELSLRGLFSIIILFFVFVFLVVYGLDQYISLEPESLTDNQSLVFLSNYTVRNFSNNLFWTTEEYNGSSMFEMTPTDDSLLYENSGYYQITPETKIIFIECVNSTLKINETMLWCEK